MLGLALEPGVPETPPARWSSRYEATRRRRAALVHDEEHAKVDASTREVQFGPRRGYL